MHACVCRSGAGCQLKLGSGWKHKISELTAFFVQIHEKPIVCVYAAAVSQCENYVIRINDLYFINGYIHTLSL